MLVKNGTSWHLMRNRYSIWLYQFGKSNLWQKGKAVTAILAEFKLEPLALKEPAVHGMYIPCTLGMVHGELDKNSYCDGLEFWKGKSKLQAWGQQLMSWDHGFCILRISLTAVAILLSISCKCSGFNHLENFLTNHVSSQIRNIKH